ncbi:MAG: carboxypeptidase regulatory-like domain-containing protein, partial [Acidobacteria bacterium]|nr:carboxypeptidase regulatory-like domain-containing protein [Acidobacteriota bacterium]
MTKPISLLIVSAGLLSSQDFRGSLQGTVTDPTQAVVSGAAVALRATDTGTERNATTDENGFYLFQFLPPGNYSISIKAAGFKSVTRQGMTLAVSQSLREDIVLEVGDTAESVNVVADISVIETDSTALGTALRQEIRDNLPLKGRSSLFMFTLTPGVVNNRYGEDTRP